MATIILGTIGAAVGAAVGGPAGARLGFSVGAVLGGALFPPRQGTQSLGRLADLKITGSSYGTTIPMVWGDFALSGIIHDYVTDASGNFLIEHSKKKGSKLTGTQRVYSYTASFAALVCRGPVSIRRIWAQDRTLYDTYAYPPSAYTLRLYRGDETQQPDSLLVTQHGATATPAYRGLCYVVFQDLNLAEWGNQLPNLVFEIAQTYPDLVLSEPSLQSYYRFDNEVGKLSDIGPKGFALTDSSPATTQVRGCFQLLNGTAGGGLGLWNTTPGTKIAHVTGNVPEFQGPRLTAEAWFRWHDFLGGSQSFFRWFDPFNSEWSFDLVMSRSGASTQFQYSINTTGGAPTLIHNISQTRDSLWHHVVVTYDAAVSTVMYIDGVSVSTVATPGSMTIAGASISQTEIGSGEYEIDEAAIYNAVLPAATVLAHYQEGAGLARTRTSPTIGSILADQFAQEGLVSSQWDVSAATDVVNGYVVTDRQSAREALDPLLRVYKTLVAEYDGKLVAVKRGGAAAATISASDLGAEVWTGSNTPTPKAVGKRLQELELPFRVDLSCFSKYRKYELASQGAARYTKTYLQDPVTITAPLVLTDDQARQAAEQQLYQVWTEREQFTFSLPLSYLYLAPGDVVNLPVLGQTLRVRIIQMDVDLPGPIHCTAVLDDVGILTQTIPGASVITSGEEAADVLSTTLIAWSGNALLNTDADTVGLYLGANGSTSGYWPGCTVYFSRDAGSSFQELETVTDGTTVGTTATALAAFTQTGQWDSVNVVDVNVLNGPAPVTTSDSDVLAGSNAAIVGDEIIQFATVTALGGSQYRLSRLLRGQRGTDGHWSEHGVGERFALVDSGLIKRETLGFDLRNKTIQIKAVTPGQAITDVAATTLYVSGDEFKTYQPVLLKGTRDGSNNLTLVWTRRDRKYVGLQDGYDEPMSETTEAYNVYIRANSPQTISGTPGITQAASAVLTVTAHPFIVGNVVFINGVFGMAQINGMVATITATTTNTITVNVDTTLFSVRTAGGTVDKVLRTIAVTTATASYTAANQTTDGLTPGNPVTFSVTQQGRYGNGYVASATV